MRKRPTAKRVALAPYDICLAVSPSGKVLTVEIASDSCSQVRAIESGQGDGNNGEQLALRFTTAAIEDLYAKRGAACAREARRKVDVAGWPIELICDEDRHLNVYIDGAEGMALKAPESVTCATAAGRTVRFCVRIAKTAQESQASGGN